MFVPARDRAESRQGRIPDKTLLPELLRVWLFSEFEFL